MDNSLPFRLDKMPLFRFRQVIGIQLVIACCCVAAAARAQDTGRFAIVTTLQDTPQRNAGQSTSVEAIRISLDLNNVSLRQALTDIAKQAHLDLVYGRADHELDQVISVHVTRVPLSEALVHTISNTGVVVTFSPDGRALVVQRSIETATNEKKQEPVGTIDGSVLDSATRKGISGATVSIQGTKLSTVTGDNGSFVLRHVPIGDHTVTVKLLGYRSGTRLVTIAEGKTLSVHFVLSPMATTLSGVVTTATGVQRKIEIGNDITTINVDSVMKTAPISSLTDLLETRVPGLTVLHSSGVPGDPSRIRLRGASSITGNNDPIVVVDGVRVYASQSDARNANLAQSSTGGTNNTPGRALGYAAPSPLDQIDPNIIATIEVFKGPSATALYGSDAANGVIVITTKHGRPDRTHWSLTLGQGVNWVPGDWPTNYYRFGSHPLAPANSAESFALGAGMCVWYDTQCQVDTVVAFQALNDSRYTVFSHGTDQQASLTVSGGVSTLLYSFTGSGRRTTGNLKLPVLEQQRYAKFYGPIPNFLVHPDRYATWSGSGQLTAQPSSALSLTWQSALFQGEQQRSSLEQAIGQLQGQYIDASQLASGGLLQNEYERATDHQLTSTHGVTVNWQALPWLRLNATGGLNTIQRTDETYIPYGVNKASSESAANDTTGWYGLGKGTSQVVTVTLGTTIPMRLVNTAVGFNYTDQSTTDVSAYTSQLAPGVTHPLTFPTTVVNGIVPSGFSQTTIATSTYGWYVQPTLHLNSRFFVSPGFRLDGGSASGDHAGLTGFPKIDFSYLAVEQEHPLGLLTLLRPRLAFGYAGTQPSPTQRLRLFNTNADMTVNNGTTSVSLDGGTTYVPVVTLSTLGNTRLRPERTSELEGGIDVGLGNDRVQVQVTAYNKTRHDAIIAVPLPPSVIGNGQAGIQINKNIGVVRNTGTEVSLTARLLDNRAISWTATTNFSQNKNKVVRLNPGESTIIVGNSRIEAGYPLWGVWERPIVSYADANDNGVIEYNEIRLGDSAAFIGQVDPKYQFNASSTVTLLNGRLGVTANVAYENGLTQTRGSLDRSNTIILNLPNTSRTSLATQAAVAAGIFNDAGEYTSNGRSSIGLTQTVNTLRINSLSINYQLPQYVARLFRAQNMSVALQGSNLGLHTNYRGMDPNVNTFSTASAGDRLQDTGQLSQPRIWTVSVRVGN